MDWKNPTGAEPVPGMSIEAFPSWIAGAIGAAGIRLIVDSAAIYVLHKDQYLPSAEAIRTGEGVNDNAKLHFLPGKTYKIRIVNMSALASEFFFRRTRRTPGKVVQLTISVLHRTGPT
jgi:iron transport multicopper oxidase